MPETADRPRAVAELKGKAADIFRSLWVSLFYSGCGVEQTAMICSADRGEGATTIACALALAGGQSAGSPRVALADFNLRTPAVHKTFRIDESPGVSDVLVDRADTASAAHNVAGSLDVFPVGGRADSSIDVLRGDAVRRFFDELKRTYEAVIVDVAPVNQYPDAQALASVIGSAVMVVHNDETPREVAVQARKRIEAGGGRLVGTVLNMRTYPIPRFLYRRV